MSKGGNTVAIVQELCESISKEQNVYVWNISYQKEGADWTLKVLVDTEEGIDINQCEAFSRALSEKMDEVDPISEAYILEVSSPGIERELTESWHFEKLQGQEIQVNLIRPVEGEKMFIGVLQKKEDDVVTMLLEDDIEMQFTMKEAAWVRKHVVF